MSTDPTQPDVVDLTDELNNLAAEVTVANTTDTSEPLQSDDVDALLAALQDTTAEATGEPPADAPVPDEADVFDPVVEAMAEVAAEDADVAAELIAQAFADDTDVAPAQASAESIDDHPDALPDEIQDTESQTTGNSDTLSLLDVTQAVSDGLAGAERKLEEIASAFEHATAELVSTPEPARAEDVGAPKACPPPSRTAVADLRTRLKEARSSILARVDELITIVEQVERLQNCAEQSLAKAKAFEQAAREAQDASQTLGHAEAEAARARQAFEEAQTRVEAARRMWTEAQTRAAVAAQAVEADSAAAPSA